MQGVRSSSLLGSILEKSQSSTDIWAVQTGRFFSAKRLNIIFCAPKCAPKSGLLQWEHASRFANGLRQRNVDRFLTFEECDERLRAGWLVDEGLICSWSSYPNYIFTNRKHVFFKFGIKLLVIFVTIAYLGLQYSQVVASTIHSNHRD